MIIYIIIIVFLSLILSVLFIPIKISVYLIKNKLDIRIFNVSLNFLNKYIPRKKKVKKTAKKSKDHLDKIKKVYSTIKKNKATVNLITVFLRLLISELKINRFHLLIDVGSNDAEKCIMNWYKFHTILGYVFYFLKTNPKAEDLKLKIYPNFLCEDSKISFNFEISFQVVTLLKTTILSYTKTKYLKKA